MSYEIEYRGYKLVFENDESAADIFLDGELAHTVTETYKLEWDDDDARQVVDTTSLVLAIRWVTADIKARKEAAKNSPVAPTLTINPPISTNAPTGEV